MKPGASVRSVAGTDGADTLAAARETTQRTPAHHRSLAHGSTVDAAAALQTGLAIRIPRARADFAAIGATCAKPAGAIRVLRAGSADFRL
jgi:hypothetical protein